MVSSLCLTYFCRSALSARKSTVLVALCHSIRKVLLPNTPHSPLNRYSTISFTIFYFSPLQVYSIVNNRNKFHVTGRWKFSHRNSPGWWTAILAIAERKCEKFNSIGSFGIIDFSTAYFFKRYFYGWIFNNFYCALNVVIFYWMMFYLLKILCLLLVLVLSLFQYEAELQIERDSDYMKHEITSSMSTSRYTIFIFYSII